MEPVVTPHARIHDVRHFRRGIFVEIDEQQRLMKILQSLIDTTRNRQIEVSLAREVLAYKAVFRQARQEGGLDLVLSVVSDREHSIQVCHCTKLLTAST